MLPDAVNELIINDIESYPYAYLITGCILLFMLMINNLSPIMIKNIFNNNNKDEFISSMAFFFGLLIHGIFEGFAVGIITLTTNDSWITLGVLFVHKIVEFASLSSCFTLANISFLYHWLLLLICELPCLITFIITWKLSSEATNNVSGVFSSLGAGTFLYISLIHLIPECLDNKNNNHSNIETYNNINNIKMINENNNIKTCACCKDDECNCGNNCQCGNAVLDNNNNSNNININQQNDNSKFMNTYDELVFKLRAFAGIGLGFVVFSLFSLQSD